MYFWQSRRNKFLLVLGEISKYTLIELIQIYTIPGSIINTDGLRSYRMLNYDGYEYYQLDHYQEWVDLFHGKIHEVNMQELRYTHLIFEKNKNRIKGKL